MVLCNVIYLENEAWAVQKRLNQSSFHLGWCMGWTQGIMCCVDMHVGASWKLVQLNDCVQRL